MPHQDHHHEHTHDAGKNIIFAFCLNLLFAVIELIGGLYTNSVAILSDALHDFGDSISLGISWRLEKISKRGKDESFSYGYRRFSLLSAIFISIVLLIGSIFIIKECIGRIISPQEVNARGMLYLAILGILVNGLAVLRLKKGNSFNERAVFLHMMEDVLGWIAVLVVSIVMMFVDLPILDPLLSIGVCIWVLTNVFRNLKGTFRILLQEIPQNINLPELQKAIAALPDVKGIHDVHTWSLDGEKNIMTLHVVVGQNISQENLHQLKIQIKDLCHKHFIEHTTVEFEQEGLDCDCCFSDEC